MHPTETPASTLIIGEWCLDPLAHELHRGDERKRLPKRLVQLLMALQQQAGTTLTREELLAAAWDRRVVSDEVLSRSIAELRQALGDDARTPRYIETIPKTGYRLIAPVRSATSGVDTAEPEASAAPETALPPAQQMATSSRLRRSLALLSVPALALISLFALSPFLWTTAEPERSGWTEAAMAKEQAFVSESEWTRQPRFSKDGQWLTFLSQSPLDGSTRVRLQSAAAGQASDLEIGRGRLSGPTLSPDSKLLAVLARANGRCEVRELRLPSGPWRAVAECAMGSGDSLEWTPDGKLIFTAPATANTGAGLVQLDLASGQRHPLTLPPTSAVADVSPRLNDQGRLAFLRGPAEAQQLWLLEDGRERVLLAQPNRIPGLAWAKDGGQLLVSSNAPGYPALLAVDPDSGESRVLGGRGAATLDVASDGSLVYEQRSYDANLWLHTEGGERRVLTRSTRYDAMPALSPDAKQVAFVSNRDGPGSIWLLSLASGAETRLPLPSMATWTRPSWSPEGTSLLLTRYLDDGTYALLRYHLADGSLQALDLPFSNAHAGMDAIDGSLFFLRSESAGNTLWHWRPGEVAQHLDGAGLISEFSINGNWLAYQRLGEPGIVVQDTINGTTQTLLAELGTAQPRHWSLQAGNLIYAATDDDGKTQLWRLDLRNGTRLAWLNADPGTAGPSIAAPGDFSAVIVSRVDRLQTDLLRVPAPD